MSQEKVYVITGGSRGIGLSLVKQLSERPNTTVIATARSAATAKPLNEWIKTHPNVHAVDYDASSSSSAKELAGAVGKITDGIDVLIANAAIGDSLMPILNESTDEIKRHFNINVCGPIEVVQSLYPLLEKKTTKQIILMSSAAGSKGQFLAIPMCAYGASKAALNYISVVLANELGPKGFLAIAIHPGGVSTDMANNAIVKFDAATQEMAKSQLITPEESAASQLKIYDGLTADDNGKFFNIDGTELPW